MKSTDYYKNLAHALVTDPEMKRRNEIFAGVDRLVSLQWEPPRAAREIPGFHKMVHPDPAENIQIATNAVAGSRLEVHIDPLPGKDREGNVEDANNREQMVKWWLSKLDRRDEGSVLEMLANSAYRYDMVAYRTEHVGYARKAKARLKEEEETRQAQLAQGGPFAWHVYHPSTVYPMFSGVGLECVLIAEVKPIHKILSYYGTAAKKLEAKLKGNLNDDQTWKFKFGTEFYYCDRDVVYCWVVPGETATPCAATSSDGVDIFKDKNSLGFIPYVVKARVTLDKDGDKHRPMLYNTWVSGWAESQNLASSLAMTTVIQNAGKPDWKHEGPAGDVYPKVDYTHLVGGVLDIPVGHTMTETQPATVDPMLLQQVDRLGSIQERVGSSRALVGATTGETYAGANLQVGQGQSTVAGGEELIKAALAAGAVQFFQWAQVVGETMIVPGVGEDAPPMGYTLDPEVINIGELYLSISLKAGKPGQNVQINNAMAIAKQFGLSDETALETAGFENPQKELERRKAEELDQVRLQNQIMLEQAQAQAQASLIQAEANIQAQQMMMEAQQAQQQAQQQSPPQQGMMGMPPQGMPPQSMMPPTNPIYSDPQGMQALAPSGLPDLGQGLNSAAGGTPPALLNQEATFEGQTGLDRQGNPIA